MAFVFFTPFDQANGEKREGNCQSFKYNLDVTTTSGVECACVRACVFTNPTLTQMFKEREREFEHLCEHLLPIPTKTTRYRSL